jgi:Holliday junction resolvase RusA-like endonuclease
MDHPIGRWDLLYGHSLEKERTSDVHDFLRLDPDEFALLDKMSRTFRFMVVGEPKGQPRPRAFARRIGFTYSARVYDSGSAEAWKSQIAISARDSGLDGVMMEGPVALQMCCYFSRPKHHYRSGKNSALIKFACEEVRKVSKPDLDNLLKAACDCLTALGAWQDDAQLNHVTVSKEWTTKRSFTEFYIVGS